MGINEKARDATIEHLDAVEPEDINAVIAFYEAAKASEQQIGTATPKSTSKHESDNGESMGYGERAVATPPSAKQPVDIFAPTPEDYEAVLSDHRRLVRELDFVLNGDNAAEQASLCDIVAQVKATKRESGVREELNDAISNLHYSTVPYDSTVPYETYAPIIGVELWYRLDAAKKILMGALSKIEDGDSK